MAWSARYAANRAMGTLDDLRHRGRSTRKLETVWCDHTGAAQLRESLRGTPNVKNRRFELLMATSWPCP